MSNLATPNGVDALKGNSNANTQTNLVHEMGEPATVRKCSQHVDADMSWYCQPCNSVVCQRCVDSDHRGGNHDVKILSDVITQQKIEVEMVLNCTKNAGAICEQSMEDFEALRKSVIESVELEAREVDWVVQQRVAGIEQEARVLKAQLKQLCKAKMAKIDQEMNRMEERSKSLQDAREVLQTFGNASPDCMYVTQHDSVVQKMKMLTMEGQDLSIDMNPLAAKFEKESKVPVSGLGRVLKVITPRKLQPVQELDKFVDAFKVAVSSGGLLAVCDSYYASKQVLVYEQQQDLYEKKLTLSLSSANPWSPRDVAITPDGKFLVARKTGIEVYSSTGTYQQTHITTSKELSDTEIDVVSVANLSDGRILAGDINRCIITEHEPSGKITWMLRTSIRPMFIAYIRDNKVAISDDKKNQVLVIDIKSGKEILVMDIPLVQGICYDEQTDSLLIVRNEASRYQQPISRAGVVEQYCCSTGLLVARLAHGLYFPKGVALKHRVFAVADQDEVKVYQV